MEDAFKLAVLDPNSDNCVPMALDEYLQRLAAGTLDWVTDLGYCSIILQTAGKEWIAKWFNLGELDNLIPQIEAAAVRLESNQEALIRSGVDDQPHAPFLLLEPSNHTISLSLFFIDDAYMDASYPVDRMAGNARALYEYVLSNRAALLGPITDPKTHQFRELPFPREELIAALKSDAALGREVYRALGIPTQY
jgi:hypothetical protein